MTRQTTKAESQGPVDVVPCVAWTRRNGAALDVRIGAVLVVMRIGPCENDRQGEGRFVHDGKLQEESGSAGKNANRKGRFGELRVRNGSHLPTAVVRCKSALDKRGGRALAIRPPRGTIRLLGGSRTPPTADREVTAHQWAIRSGCLFGRRQRVTLIVVVDGGGSSRERDLQWPFPLWRGHQGRETWADEQSGLLSEERVRSV